MDFQHNLILTPRRNKVGGCTASRSTSAGSSPQIDHLVALELPLHNSFSPAYPTDVLGLPEYDYPAPWSVERPAPKLPDGGYILDQLKVKNTFLGTDAMRPQSLAEYFAERQTQSCPPFSSGISLPPGLEDLVEPEEAAARLVVAEANWRKLEKVESEYLPSGLFDAPLDASAPEFLPGSSLSSSLLDALGASALDFETTAPLLDASAPEFLPASLSSSLFGDAGASAFEFVPSAVLLDPSAPEFLPVAFQTTADFNDSLQTSAAPLLQEHDQSFHCRRMTLLQELEDLTAALGAPVHGAQAPPSSSFDAVMAALSASVAPAEKPSHGFDAAAPAFEPAKIQQAFHFDTLAPAFEPAKQSAGVIFATAPPANAALPASTRQPSPEFEASSEHPTVGSEGHWEGTCRPCAFLYTKGCGNGVTCSFCHICKPGEKKRRSRRARTSQRVVSAAVSTDAAGR